MAGGFDRDVATRRKSFEKRAINSTLMFYADGFGKLAVRINGTENGENFLGIASYDFLP
jgi:hypothetical protein